MRWPSKAARSNAMKMNLAEKVAAAVVFLLMLTASRMAGDDKSQTGITFTSRTELVQVPVVVTDKSGQHVSGLKKEDFELQENGQSTTIASFEEVKTLTGRPSHPAPQRGVYTNELSNDSTPKRMTIFALDLINTPYLDQAYARQQLIKFLANRVDSQEPIALVVIKRNGITVLHDFTSDPAVLVAALKNVSGDFPAVQMGTGAGISTEARQLSDFVAGTGLEAYVMLKVREAMMVTLESFQHVAEAYAGVPGRKSLIWATAGFPFGLDPVTGTILSPQMFLPASRRTGYQGPSRTGALPQLPSNTTIRSSDDLESLQPLYQRTLQMLSDASISVYPVDARGLLVFFPGADTSRIDGISARKEALFEASRETMVGFAEMTGGKAFYNRNDLDVAFQKAADDSSTYYMLGYYLDKNPKPGWHKLHVKLKNGANEARSRNGFFVTPDSKHDETEKFDIQMAMASPLDYSAVPFSVTWGTVQAQGPNKKVHFQLNLPPSSNIVDMSSNGQLDLQVVCAARTATGQSADHFGQHLQANLKEDALHRYQQEGLNYGNDVIVPAGDYEVRFVVRDNLSGRLGTVTAPLRVTQ